MTNEEKEKLIADAINHGQGQEIADAMVCPVRCGGMEYEDDGTPFLWIGGQKMKQKIQAGNVNIACLGADGHGKTTLTAAIVSSIDQIRAYCPSGSLGPDGMERTKEIIRLVLKAGGIVDLGCDPGMTQEGKELVDFVRKLKETKI